MCYHVIEKSLLPGISIVTVLKDGFLFLFLIKSQWLLITQGIKELYK